MATLFKSIPVSASAIFSIMRGAGGSRKRLNELASCATAEDIANLSWVKTTTPMGKVDDLQGPSIHYYRQTLSVSDSTTQSFPYDIVGDSDEMDFTKFNITKPAAYGCSFKRASYFTTLQDTYDIGSVQYSQYSVGPTKYHSTKDYSSYERYGGFLSQKDLSDNFVAPGTFKVNIAKGQIFSNMNLFGFAVNNNYNTPVGQTYNVSINTIKGIKNGTIETIESSSNFKIENARTHGMQFAFQFSAQYNAGFSGHIATGSRSNWNQMWDVLGDIYGISTYHSDNADNAYNTCLDIKASYWVFRTEQELDNYLRTGDYTAAINYANPHDTGLEFDTYYRARYGAEFPWPDDPEPEPVPSDPIIAGTFGEIGFRGSGFKGVEPEEVTRAVDLVTMNYLTPGNEYILVGKIWDINAKEKTSSSTKPSTSKSDKDDDEEEEKEYEGAYLEDVRVTLPFTATDPIMDVVIEYEFSSIDLAGHTLVFHTELYYSGTGEEAGRLADSYKKNDDADEQINILEPAPPEPWDDSYSLYPGVFGKDWTSQAIIDQYESLIWTDRLWEAGDFELHCLPDPDIYKMLTCDSYFYIPQSDHYMVVEKVEIESDPDDGNKMTISGRSIESILDRRVIWRRTSFENGSLQNCVKKLIYENVIDPEDPGREIKNFIFKESSDYAITSLRIDAVEYIGDNLYDVICDICKSHHIGWKITIDNQYRFVFELYPGVDRSYNNSKNNQIIYFGPEFDNVVNSNYVENKEAYKNVARVAGEGTGSEQMFGNYNASAYAGLDRREAYVSATDLTKKINDEEEMSDNSYKKALAQRGKEGIAEYKYIKSADGTMCTEGLVYMEDFYTGDLVEFQDTYGHNTTTRITEVIISHDSNGFTIYPTFQQDTE